MTTETAVLPETEFTATRPTSETLRRAYRLMRTADELARLYGPAHIGALEDGSGPARDPQAKPGRQMIDDIRLWLAARGSSASPWAVATSILQRGTRLFRGEDPRFGKPTGTLRLVLQQSRTRLRGSLSAEVRRSLGSELFPDLTSTTAY